MKFLVKLFAKASKERCLFKKDGVFYGQVSGTVRRRDGARFLIMLPGFAIPQIDACRSCFHGPADLPGASWPAAGLWVWVPAGPRLWPGHEKGPHRVMRACSGPGAGAAGQWRVCWMAESSQVPVPAARTKVHSSATVVRLAGSPSITRPVMSVVMSIMEYCMATVA